MKIHEKPTWNHEKPWKTMKNQPGNIKSMKNQPGTMKNHENQPDTMKNKPGIIHGGQLGPRVRDMTFFLSKEFRWASV